MDYQIRSRSIIHFDMDAFYPAVEVQDNPELKGRPVIVGGGKKRGVVSSASYEARKFGVHSAQPIATALRLCPDSILLPVRMHRYKEVSRIVFEIFSRFTPLVEPLSIDEAFLDITGSERLLGTPTAVAARIRKLVFEETGLTVSAGVAPSKFVAKIASDMEKPDGLTVVPADKVREFLDPLPIKKMWGIGRVTQKALAHLNVRTFIELRQVPVEVLERRFGKHGVSMHLLSMGIDERDVEPGYEAKSIGHERTFPEDMTGLDDTKKELLALASKVARRMRKKEVTGKTVSLKVKYHDFKQVTRSATLKESTDDGFLIYSTVCRLLLNTDAGKKPVRLLGISVSQLNFLGTAGQLSLFGPDELTQKRRRLNVALDSVYEKHGEKGLRPGSLFSNKGAVSRD